MMPYCRLAAALAPCLVVLLQQWQVAAWQTRRHLANEVNRLQIRHCRDPPGRPLLSVSSDEELGVQAKNAYKLSLDDAAVRNLQQRLQNQEGKLDPLELVEVEGYVTSKRNFGHSFCFFDLSRRDIQVPVQAMLKRQSFGDPDRFDGFMKSLVPGIRLCVTGSATPTRNPGEASILVKGISIQKLPHNPQHVRKLLRLVSEGLLDARDLTTATKLDDSELLSFIRDATKVVAPSHPKAFNGLAARILANLNEELESDKEYPYFSTDYKYTTSLPAAPSEIQQPPISSFETAEHGVVGLDLTDPLSVHSVLQELETLQTTNTTTNTTMTAAKTIKLVGWIQNRRRFKKSITVLEVVDEMDDHKEDSNNPQIPADPWNVRLKCIIHPRVLSDLNATRTDMYGQLLSPGSRVMLIGHILPPNPDTAERRVPKMWIYNIVLLQASWWPSTVQYLIERTVAGEFQVAEAARALKLSNHHIEHIVTLGSLTMQQWEVAEISQKLQQQSIYPSAQVDSKARTILAGFADLRAKYPINIVDTKASLSMTDFVSTQGSRWKTKKEPQLDWMVQQVVRVLKQRYHDRCRNETLQILDVGGGKGFLADRLASTLLAMGFDTRILVVDIAEGAVNNGRRRAERRNHGVVIQYTVADASTVDLRDYGQVDLVVALHACGALTDVALGHALCHQAAFVICPCCFCSNPGLLVPERRNQQQSLLSVPEWLGIEATQYDKVKNLAELQGDTMIASVAMHTICGMRLAAVERHAAISMDLSLHAFPVAFSTRNVCLVGTPRRLDLNSCSSQEASPSEDPEATRSTWLS
jgi:Methyltransferase domain